MLQVIDNLPEFYFLEVGDFIIYDGAFESSRIGRITEVIGDRYKCIEMVKRESSNHQILGSSCNIRFTIPLGGNCNSIDSNLLNTIIGGTCNTSGSYSSIIGGYCNISSGGYGGRWYPDYNIKYKFLSSGKEYSGDCSLFRLDRESQRNSRISIILGI